MTTNTEKYDVECKVQGHWSKAQIGFDVNETEAICVAAYCRMHGDETRIVHADTQEIATIQ